MTALTILTPDAQYDDGGELERRETGPDVTWRIFRESQRAALPKDALATADAVVAWHVMAIDAAFIAELKRCRLIVRAGVGVDHIDLRAAGRAGIPVCNTPDYGVSEVADHAIALMLALRRGVLAYAGRMREDPAAAFGAPRPLLVRRNRGQVMGIVGFGAIGLATALRARAFGMRVVVYDPYAASGIEIAAGVSRAETLEDLLERADVISLHCPLTEETRGMIDARALARMKPGGLIVNTARGPIVDVAALIDALERGQVGGAALDVFDVEPIPNDSLLSRYVRSEAAAVVEGRLILTPHASWVSPESAADVRRLSAATAAGFLRHGRLRNLVNGAFLGESGRPLIEAG